MALVAYSDESDISDSDEECPKISIEKKGINKVETFKIPIQNGNVQSVEKEDENSTVPELADDDDVVNDVPTVQTWNVIKNKEPSLGIGQIFKKDPKSKKLKLVLPALSEFDDDEDEEQIEEEVKRKKIQPSSRGTGLFAVLPKPKSGTTTSLVPLNVSKRMLNKPEKSKKVMKQKPPELASNKFNDSDEEWDSSTTNDFFSLEKSTSPPPLDSKTEIEINIKPKVDISLKPRIDISQEVPEPQVSVNEYEQVATSDQPTLIKFDDSGTYDTSKQEIDTQALSRLAGRRNRGEIPNIIDINADDALMSREEWVTRALCDEKPKTSFSRKREGIPSQQQRRKHQITYLAHQAKEREQELQNAWGQNRFTKMQTQSRYGF